MRKLLLLLFSLTSTPCLANGIVELDIDNNKTTADYRAGNVKKPLLIVLHGFLQTYQFQATKNIIDGLAANGYPVLGPNLSLGINNRKKSLECEAVHTHTLANDIREIRTWIEWGKSKGYRRYILVGHSWGSHHILAMMEKAAQPAGLMGVILVSLTPIDNKNLSKQIRFANKSMRSKTRLGKYHLGFCRNYTSTPESFVSYAKWSNRRAIKTLRKIKTSPIQAFIILGSKDKRLSAPWLKQLDATHIDISTITGANHFFSSVYEFDLIDQLTNVLLEIKG